MLTSNLKRYMSVWLVEVFPPWYVDRLILCTFLMIEFSAVMGLSDLSSSSVELEDMNAGFRVYRILFPSEMDYINMRMHRFHKVPNHSLNS